MPLGNLHLLRRRIAGQFDHLQAGRARQDGSGSSQFAVVTKSTRERSKGHVQIMVDESVVLGRVQHLQQGRRRDRPGNPTHLIQFVQQDDRVARFDPAQRLKNASGQRAHISPAMPANFRLIPHAAKGNAGKFSAQRVRHAFAQGGLAHAGRPDQAKNRAFQLLFELDDGQKFQQAVLDFAQPKMLFVQQPPRRRQIQLVLREFRPRQIDQPVQIIARHGVFGHGRGHLLQPLQFLQGGFFGSSGNRFRSIWSCSSLASAAPVSTSPNSR